MSIPFVRYVQGEDDGCALWECLGCYGSWVVRGSPVGWEGELIWKFCPLCGLQWEGEKKWDQGRKFELGHGLNTEPYPDARLRPLRFSLQTRFTPTDTRGKLDVESRTDWRNEYTVLRDAVTAFKALQSRRANEEEDAGSEFGLEEFRVIPLRKDA